MTHTEGESQFGKYVEELAGDPNRLDELAELAKERMQELGKLGNLMPAGFDAEVFDAMVNGIAAHMMRNNLNCDWLLDILKDPAKEDVLISFAVKAQEKVAVGRGHGY